MRQHNRDSPKARRRAAADRTEQAARRWLESLGAEQLQQAKHLGPEYDATDGERLRWFYTPTNHGGLALRDQTPRQQSLAMQLLASGTSPAGYATIATVLGLENILDEVEGWTVDWGRERGRDPGLFWVRTFGEPGDRAWGWRFGGHHVSVNVLVVDGELVSTTPCFIGADPAQTQLLGGTSRPLGGPEDLARTLFSSLRPAQRYRALLHVRAVSDIVSGNRPVVEDGAQMMHMQDLWREPFTDPRLRALVDEVDRRAESASGYSAQDHARVAIRTTPAGLPGHELDDEQRELLRALVAMYTGRAPLELAEEMDDLYATDEALGQVHFAWAGESEPGRPHYYRIQGPELLVEYDNTQRGGNHAHSVWRHPTGDFGLDVLREHRSRRHS